MISQDISHSTSTAMFDGIEFRCPRCTAPFESAFEADTQFICVECHFPLTQIEGVWRTLPIERAAYYARFIRDYEAIRSAEGRGSTHSNYYLNLPDVDRSNPNFAQWKIRSRTYDAIKKDVLSEIISRNEAPRILDIGAGNGWLSYRMTQMGVRAVAVDLLVNKMDGLGAAMHYDKHLKHPFLRVEAEYDRLPFCDGQFDAVVFNASFHYSESYERTLREAIRCLKVGGTIVIADSPSYSSQQSGEQMLAERRHHFFNRFGIFSDSIHSQEFLTSQRLDHLAQLFDLQWRKHSPYYGIHWSLRPWIAKLRNRREPSRFLIYIAEKHA